MGVLLVLRRTTAWLAFFFLILGSYAWWGSDRSPIGVLVPVSLSLYVCWFALGLLVRNLFHRVRALDLSMRSDARA